MKNLEGKKNNYKQCALIDSIQYHARLTVDSQVTWIFCNLLLLLYIHLSFYVLRQTWHQRFIFYYISTYPFSFLFILCRWSYVGIHWFSLFCFCLFFKGFYDEHGSFIKHTYIYIYIYIKHTYIHIYIYIYIKSRKTWIVNDLVKNTKIISIEL